MEETNGCCSCLPCEIWRRRRAVWLHFTEKAKLNRESLYRMLLKKGNPEINRFFIPLGTPYHTKESQQML